jgi:beta-glucosidase
MMNEIQRFLVEETRLGIPAIFFDETLHGLVREGATSFPQSIGLASTWDPALMEKVAEAIARETKSRGIRQTLSPSLEVIRDVRWGRVEEVYGEDPFLAARMGVAYVKAFEKMGVITTPKVLIANAGDGGRDSYPIQANERLLEEIYFPPFRDCVLEAGSTSVMTAYNSLASQNGPQGPLEIPGIRHIRRQRRGRPLGPAPYRRRP